jgi:hypothetical protein
MWGSRGVGVMRTLNVQEQLAQDALDHAWKVAKNLQADLNVAVEALTRIRELGASTHESDAAQDIMSDLAVEALIQIKKHREKS